MYAQYRLHCFLHSTCTRTGFTVPRTLLHTLATLPTAVGVAFVGRLPQRRRAGVRKPTSAPYLATSICRLKHRYR